MSAYMLDDKNLDFILSVLVDRSTAMSSGVFLGEKFLNIKNHYEPECVKNLTEIGNVLKAQNLRSVNHRYKQNLSLPKYTFKYTHYDKSGKIVTALKLLDCYEYQSCETDDYEQTVAYKFVNSARKKLIRTIDGYDDAPWGLS